MNQLRRKGKSKCRNSKRRNSKLRKSRRKTRVKRQYKRTASRVKRNTYRKNRKRHTKRRIRGGLLLDTAEEMERKGTKMNQLLDKWENYQKRKDAFDDWDNSGMEMEPYPVARGGRSPYHMDLGDGSLRKQAKEELGEQASEGDIQKKMDEYLQEIILTLPDLEYLDISGNGLNSLSDLMQYRTKLRFLNIKGNPELLDSKNKKSIEMIQRLMKSAVTLGEGGRRPVKVLWDSKGEKPGNE